MKRETLRHPKTQDLAARLDVSRPTALGILTLLWDFTADHAIQGNVGKWANGAIARACDWTGSAEAFVEALVESGWVDVSETSRLIIHDWPHHCERWVSLKMGKLGLSFLPEYSLTERSIEPTVEATVEPSPPRDRTEPNRTKPNPTEPNERFARAGERSDEFRISQIDIGETQWKDLSPLMKRIAQVVTKRTDVSARHLREPDYELCARAAALANYHLSRAWLDPVLRSIKQRRDPADNPWAHFRSLLITESEKRGHKFHDLEALVDVPKREQPVEVPP